MTFSALSSKKNENERAKKKNLKLMPHEYKSFNLLGLFCIGSGATKSVIIVIKSKHNHARSITCLDWDSFRIIKPLKNKLCLLLINDIL